MQTFANASIYYHTVMGSEAKVVYGGIRGKYLTLGGHDVNQERGKRLLGFPLTDEENSKDGRCRVTRFEWGAIYWVNGGVYLDGKIYEEYMSGGGEEGLLGYPIADPVRLTDGYVVFFELGCMYMGARSRDQVIDIRYSLPQLGLPWLIQPGQFSDQVVVKFNFFRQFINANIAGNLFAEIFNGRLVLRETAGNDEIPLEFNVSDTKDLAFSENIRIYQSVVRLGNASSVKSRKLYDFVLRFPNRLHVVAPHSVYFRDDWHDFQFIHITDLHVSRRLDRFRKFFSDRSMDDAVRNFNNFNDTLREFIKYANKMHVKGKLDFIMMTGDLVDYIFEDGGKSYHNNNFVFLEQILRGLTGEPDQVKNVELKVPIFTSLGNHDYRVEAYYPLFTVDLQWPVGNKTMEQFGSVNLTRDEAKVITEDLLNIRGMISTDRAIDMIRPDRENQQGTLNYYFRYICSSSSYTVPLGDHRIVMIDGKWDDGTIESTWDGIKHYLGFSGEATDNFADGSPDSVGFNSQDSDLISKALQTSGLVVIGVHAPLINPKGGEFAWF